MGLEDMPAKSGNLRKYRLGGVADASHSAFQLPHHLSSYPAHPVTTDPKQIKKLRHERPPLAQLATMSRMVNELGSDYYLQDAMGNPGGLGDEFSIVGEEFLFHGTAVDWDTIHAAGGLRCQGANTSPSDHVASSATNQTAYVSGSRRLSVAKSFAKGTDGWVYLLYSPHGIAVDQHFTHKQAEVAAMEKVPLTDIFLFKHLADPSLIYENLTFRSSLATAPTLDRCLRLIGGGTYPVGMFYAIVP